MNWFGAFRPISKLSHFSWTQDKEVPDSMDMVEGGNLLIPWRGNHRYLILVIDYKTKDKYNSEIYMYQMQFPLVERNVVEFHYYHCVSGYNTVVGVANTVDDIVSWDIKPNQPYMKKALRIDTSSDYKDELVQPNFTPSFPPSNNNQFGNTSKPTNEWETKAYWSDTQNEYEVKWRSK